jgi:hypothetical protein
MFRNSGCISMLSNHFSVYVAGAVYSADNFAGIFKRMAEIELHISDIIVNLNSALTKKKE